MDIDALTEALAGHFPMHYPHGWECRCGEPFDSRSNWAAHVVDAVGLPEVERKGPAKTHHYVAQHFPYLHPDRGYVCGCGSQHPTGPTIPFADTAHTWARHAAQTIN